VGGATGATLVLGDVAAGRQAAAAAQARPADTTRGGTAQWTTRCLALSPAAKATALASQLLLTAV